MTQENQQEMFSIAYVRAVVATAGYNVYKPEVDDDSVDLGISARGPMGVVRSPKIELQLKCTTDANFDADNLKFRLKLKNYEDLIPTNCHVPRILVVVVVPSQVLSWLDLTEGQLSLRNCGYWVSLCGKGPYSGSATDTKITVPIPRLQLFTVAQLRVLMATAGRGEKP